MNRRIIYIIMIIIGVHTPSLAQTNVQKETQSIISKMFDDTDKDANQPSQVPSKIENTITWKGSLMYDKEDFNFLKEARRSYEMKIPIDVLLPGIFQKNDVAKKSVKDAKGLAKEVSGIKDLPVEEKVDENKKRQDVLETIKNIRLASIVYFSPDVWSIWINGKKITPDHPSEILRVSTISEEYVVLVWPNMPLEYVFPDLEKKMVRFGNGKLVTNAKNVVVNTKTKDVSFLLRPNQTFVPTKMAIFEGNISVDVISDLADVNQLDNKIAEDVSKGDKNDAKIDSKIAKEDEKANQLERDMMLKNIDQYKDQLMLIQQSFK